MALRKPIVIVAGQLQQLQSGDSLDESGANQLILTNNNAGSILIGAVVYIVANDAVDKAQANAVGTKDVFGLVATSPSIANGAAGAIQYSDVLALSTAQWDAVFGTTGGLTKNVRYYLSQTTAGQGTATAPTTVGQYVIEIGIGVSTTELKIDIKNAVLL